MCRPVTSQTDADLCFRKSLHATEGRTMGKGLNLRKQTFILNLQFLTPVKYFCHLESVISFQISFIFLLQQRTPVVFSPTSRIDVVCHAPSCLTLRSQAIREAPPISKATRNVSKAIIWFPFQEGCWQNNARFNRPRPQERLAMPGHLRSWEHLRS